MTTTITASPARLRDGSWGARVRSEATAPGDVVTITTRSGKSWDARVTRVVWTGDGVAVCATQSLDRPDGGSRSSRRRGRSCACDQDCCARGCQCDAHCVCRGGNIYDC